MALFLGVNYMILFLSIFLVFLLSHSQALQNKPKIAIVTTPLSGELKKRYPQYTSKICPEYPSWFQGSGIQTVPLPYTSSKEETERILANVHGIVFQGGDSDWLFEGHPYLEFGKSLWKIAKSERLPLWMTCLGFEEALVLETGNSSIFLDTFDAENLMLPLDFTKLESRMFSSASKEVKQTFSRFPVTVNLHHNGVTVDVFQSNSRLTSFFDVISTNTDRNGKKFVSAIEAKDFPIYAVQFHPERNHFIFDETANDHSMEAIQAMQYLSNFFSKELRTSKKDVRSDDHLLLDRFSTEFVTVSDWQRSLYLF